MFDRERSIIAQNAANVAATLLGALARRDDIPSEVFTLEYFESWRNAIAQKTWSMAQTKDTPPAPVVQASPDPYPASVPSVMPSQPAVTLPQCPHGERVFKSGLNEQTGKRWNAWFCALPKGTPGTCKAMYV